MRSMSAGQDLRAVVYGSSLDKPTPVGVVVPRRVPFVRYALVASICCLVLGFVVGLSIGITTGNVWLVVGASSIVMVEGLAGGLLCLFLLGRLMTGVNRQYNGPWKSAGATYLPYAASGVAAAAFALFVRQLTPGNVQALEWWQNGVIMLLASCVWVLLAVAVNRLSDREDRIEAYVGGLVKENTRRRVAEDALLRARNELEERVSQRTSELSEANERLEHELSEGRRADERMQELYQAEKGLRQELETETQKRVMFLRTLVHELKTPLTSVTASSELLEAELPEGHLLHLAKNLHRSAVNLNSRIDELLDLAKGELGMLHLDRAAVHPLALLRAAFDDMSPVASRMGQSVVLDLPAALPLVWGDEIRLRQIVLNLLNNAFKYTPEGGKVILRARDSDTCLLVEIQDTGVGIPEEEQQRLFDPYYRVEGDRERFSGLGLGLALCRTLTELHGGQISVKSERGKGSTFAFTVPLCSAQQADEQIE